MHGDVMYEREVKSLLCLSMPLGLLTITPLASLTGDDLTEALRTHVVTLMSRRYVVTIIHLDPQRGFLPAVKNILGAEVDIGGRGDHTRLVDNRMRHLKELSRSVYDGLPWTMPVILSEALLIYSVSRMNLRKSSTLAGESPRVAFTGRKPSWKSELSIAFGDYVEGYNSSGADVQGNRIDRGRTNSLIALYPTGNSNGSWVCYNVLTGMLVRCTNLVLMVTTDLVIEHMNALAAPKKEPLERLVFDEYEDKEQEVIVDARGTAHVDLDPRVVELDSDDSDSDSTVSDEKSVETSEPMANPSMTTDSNKTQASAEDPPPSPKRRSARVVGGVRRPERYSYATKTEAGKAVRYRCYHTSAKRAIKEQGKPAFQAVVDELVQMIRTKRALRPVMKSTLSRRQMKGVIRSFMFLKTKFNAEGKFEKIKARMVANGKQQDRSLYPDTYSPTVAIQSVLMSLVIAAAEGRKACCIDIGGAYLNAERTESDGEEIIMEIEPYLTSILSQVAPEVTPYVDAVTGKLYVKVEKALYGTLDAARIWYDKITGVLLSMGYVQNSVDKCVFNKLVGEVQLTIMLYVDDLLVTCVDEQLLTGLVDDLKAVFEGDVKHSIDKDLSYLGMHIKVEQGRITVSMKAYVEALLQECGITGKAASPAKSDLFAIDTRSELLDPKARELFHSLVAKLLYLAKRIRVDILLAVAFLTTRVQSATKQDQEKLTRVLKYLNGNVDEQLVIKPGEDLKVTGYVDASFCIHDVDAKGHTGLIVCVGGIPVLFQLSKHKIVTKDSTESELVGVSDKHLIILQCHDFMVEQGYGDLAPVILQDNMSTISLITKGGGKYRNKYLRVRQAAVKQVIDDGDMKVEYVPAGKMLADQLSKPLQGELFRSMVRSILRGTLSHHRGT
jgi:hypothetical protein